MIWFACISTAVLFGVIGYALFPPLPKLSSQLAPYDTVAKIRLNGTLASNTRRRSGKTNTFFVFELFKPVYEILGRIIARIASLNDAESLTLKLEQAGLDESVETYSASVVKQVLIFTALGILFGAISKNVNALIFLPLLFSFVSFTKTRAKIDKLIEQRRITIRSELYTIDQLLALYVRTGAGVSQALTSISQRTNGIVSDEIANILSRVRSGMAIDQSLYIASKKTPEPHAMRTYKLLAAASKRGVDLTQGLLDLAKDLRRSLREDIKANGTKRRAAMLIPTIGILAPIMLLFVAAPIPSIVLGGR